MTRCDISLVLTVGMVEDQIDRFPHQLAWYLEGRSSTRSSEKQLGLEGELKLAKLAKLAATRWQVFHFGRGKKMWKLRSKKGQSTQRTVPNCSVDMCMEEGDACRASLHEAIEARSRSLGFMPRT